jgi:DNA-binding transcriptional regulator YhcF (GntR family)
VITVKRAYEELERDGIIYRRQGLGTFVADAAHDRSREVKKQRAIALLRDAVREGTEAGLSARDIAQAPASPSSTTKERLVMQPAVEIRGLRKVIRSSRSAPST